MCIASPKTKYKKKLRTKKKELKSGEPLLKNTSTDTTKNKRNNDNKKYYNTNTNSNMNQKKISLIEFLYKSEDSAITSMKKPTSENTTSVKIPHLQSWLSEEFNAFSAKRDGKVDNKKALVLYKDPYDLFAKTLRKYLQNVLVAPESTNNYTISVQEIAESDSESDKMGSDSSGSLYEQFETIADCCNSIRIQEVVESDSESENMGFDCSLPIRKIESEKNCEVTPDTSRKLGNGSIRSLFFWQ